MTGWFALAVLVAAVGTIQILLCALVVATLMPQLRRALEASAMAGRTRSLVIVAGLPLLAGGVLVGACMVPSLITKLGLGSDHCLVHLDHALHLCLRHLPSTAPTLAVSVVVAVGGAMLVSALWRGAMLMISGRNEARALSAIARRRGGIGWIESDLPLALTVGLLRPEVYVSSGFESGLDEIELRAALAHEQCHARERHPLLKLLVTVMAMFHLPGARRELVSLLDLACERRADESAATEVDRARVASALVRAHRLVGGQPSTSMAFADGCRSSLECRVRDLLNEPAIDNRPSWWMWMITMAIAAPAIANHELHHAVEHLLALIG